LAAPDPSRVSTGDPSIATRRVKSSPDVTQTMASVTLTNESTGTGG